jgi:hypothetical protein
MKAKYKLSATERANYKAYQAYVNANRALFRIAHVGSNAMEIINEAGPEAVAAYDELFALLHAHLAKKEAAWEAICLANPNDEDCIGA